MEGMSQMRIALQTNQMNIALGWTDLACTDVKGAKVLIVDDDPLIRLTLQSMITKFGYGTRTTSSAEACSVPWPKRSGETRRQCTRCST